MPKQFQVPMTEFELAQAWLTACEVFLETEDTDYRERRSVQDALMEFITTGEIPLHHPGEDE